MSAPLSSFFQGTLSVDQLRTAAKIRVRREGGTKTIGALEPQDKVFRLAPAHLITLCDMTIARKLSEVELSDIAFWIYAADEIDWDEREEVIPTTLLDWASPETTFPIKPVTLKKFRERLVTGDLSIRIA